MVLRGGSRAAATSKMECFEIIVNGFQPLTIITKCSILDVTAVLDLDLHVVLKLDYSPSILKNGLIFLITKKTFFLFLKLSQFLYFSKRLLLGLQMLGSEVNKFE